MDVVHRDINPRNVMLSVSGDVKIIDFGVAKAVDKLDTTRTNALKGKIAYMAPEQMDSQPIDGRADLFAVGLMLQEFINGASPFSGLNEVQIMKRVLDGNLGELISRNHPDPEELQTIRSRAVAVDPADRYQKAEHFLMDIELALEPLGGGLSREERAAFLRDIDPVVVDRIERRLEGDQSGASRLDGVDGAEASDAILVEGSMSKTVNELDRLRLSYLRRCDGLLFRLDGSRGTLGRFCWSSEWLLLGQGMPSLNRAPPLFRAPDLYGLTLTHRLPMPSIGGRKFSRHRPSLSTGRR